MAAVLAPEQADIRVGDEHSLRVKGVKENPVVGGDVETGGRVGRVRQALGIDRVPGAAAVRGAHGAAVIGPVADVRIGWPDSQ